MEQWVKEWLKEQRDQGVKCLEVKMQGKSHYVYHSTTYWDKALKKPRKPQNILGCLIRIKGSSSPAEDIEFIRPISETSRNMATRCCCMKQ